jgi:DNA-binding FrmR family transcriptional regulator
MASVKKQTTTNNNIDMDFINEYAPTAVQQAFGDAEDDPEQAQQLADVQQMIKDAMVVMAKHTLDNLPKQQQQKEQQKEDKEEVVELLTQLKTLSKPSASGVKHNLSAYTLWAKQWRLDNGGGNPPSGLWEQECADDPSIKTHYQKLADQVNKDEGRVSMKGKTRASSGATGAVGYRDMQKRLGELNLLIKAQGHKAISCNDQEFENCKVRGAGKKILGPESIKKLEKFFSEEYGIKI